jgi:hypothetical protein
MNNLYWGYKKPRIRNSSQHSAVSQKPLWFNSRMLLRG